MFIGDASGYRVFTRVLQGFAAFQRRLSDHAMHCASHYRQIAGRKLHPA
jgi:hypothetical protein